MNRQESQDLRRIAIKVVARRGLIRPDWKSAHAIARDHAAEVRQLETQAIVAMGYDLYDR